VVAVLRIEERSDAVVEVRDVGAEGGLDWFGRGGGGGIRRDELPEGAVLRFGLDGAEFDGDCAGRDLGRSGNLGGVLEGRDVVSRPPQSWLTT